MAAGVIVVPGNAAPPAPERRLGRVLTAISMVSAHDARAVGQSLARSPRPTALTERWNGHSWYLS